MIRIATDAGGTFTDLVAFDEASGPIYRRQGADHAADPPQGVLARLAPGRRGRVLARGRVSSSMAARPSSTPSPSGKACAPPSSPPPAFATCIAIGRGNRPDLYNLHSRPPEPFVPRQPASSRSTSGSTPRRSAHAALAGFARHGGRRDRRRRKSRRSRSLFLHAYANPAHEERGGGSACASVLPGVAIDGQPRDFAAMARIRTQQHGGALRLRAAGDGALPRQSRAARRGGAAITGPIYCMQSNGGLAGSSRARGASAGAGGIRSRRRRCGRRAYRRGASARPTSSISTSAARRPNVRWCCAASRD